MILVRLLRRLLGIAPPLITKVQAIAIARAECERRGYPWREPMRADEHLREYVVWILGQTVGGNLGFHIDIHTGAITRVTTLPR